MRLTLIFITILSIAGTLLYLVKSEEYELLAEREFIIKERLAAKAMRKKAKIDRQNERMNYYYENLETENVDLSDLELEVLPMELLQKMTNLKYLDLSKNQLTNIDDLFNLPTLEYLYVFSNPITEINISKDNLVLEELIITGGELYDFPDLSALKALRLINFSNSHLYGKIDLSAKVNDAIEKINFSNNAINELTGLENFKQLKKIDLSNNIIKRVPDFTYNENLAYIDLSNNLLNNMYFTDYEGINPNLINVDLSNNEIDTLIYTAALANLKSLDLSNNNIVDLKDLSYFTKLRTIDLAYNGIKGIIYNDENFAIDTLLLNNNQIDYFEYGSATLTYLDCSFNNKLKAANFNLYTPNLTFLDISNMTIEANINMIATLKGLESLEVLRAQNTRLANPMHESAYKEATKNIGVVTD